MAPGRKRDLRKEKKKNTNFAVGNKAKPIESVQKSSSKKAKQRNVSKKKLKEQTTKWIEDVNESFSSLQHQFIDDNKTTEPKELCQERQKDTRNQRLKSDVSETELTKTISDMANLLEQS